MAVLIVEIKRFHGLVVRVRRAEARIYKNSDKFLIFACLVLTNGHFKFDPSVNMSVSIGGLLYRLAMYFATRS